MWHGDAIGGVGGDCDVLCEKAGGADEVDLDCSTTPLHWDGGPMLAVIFAIEKSVLCIDSKDLVAIDCSGERWLVAW